MTFITNAGSPVVCIMVLLAALSYFYFRKSRQLFLTTLIIIFALPIAPLLKELTRRVRPDNEYVRGMIFQTYSFPSGHAYYSFLVFGFFAFLAWRYLKSDIKLLLVGGLVLLIFFVGVSRIYLGAHFPSDVFAGWILAAVVLFAAVRLAAKAIPKRKTNPNKLRSSG